MTRALLFDLDDTLIREEPAAVAAFEATAQAAAALCGEVDVAALALDARKRARELWSCASTYAYCRSIGMSSWEGLWCRFEGHWPEVRALRQWAPTYRRETWRLALADQGLTDQELAEQLAERFGIERRVRHEVFEDVTATLESLQAWCTVALVTNGASCLQREKLEASGLSQYFDAVVISAEVGVAKPEPSIFTHALSQLGSTREDGVMIGDSLARDVEGAVAAGLRAVWINRVGVPRPEGRPHFVEISTLTDLPKVLDLTLG